MPGRDAGFREDDSWFSEEQLTKVTPADEADDLRSPIPTQMVSNGEYMPHPQTEKQKHVEYRIKELADAASKKLGVSRRQFLASSGGMAAAFLAMNEVFGQFFEVDPIEMFEPEAYASTGVPSNLFVCDDQLHIVRSSRTGPGNQIRHIAQGLPNPSSNPTNLPDELGGVNTPWNPALVGIPNVQENWHLPQFIKDVYLDSQVTVGILTNNNNAAIPNVGGTGTRAPKNVQESEAFEGLTAEQTMAARNFINAISGSQRALGHGQLYMGIGNLDYMRYQIEDLKPDCWKGYNIARAAKVDFDPESDMRRWRLDDEAVAYPTYELIYKYKNRLKKYPGFFNLSVHKGLSTDAGPEPELGHPMDIPKAATDWPEFNFIIYHACLRPGFWVMNALNEIRSGQLRGGVPDIKWTTEFAQISAPYRNVYAEIGTSFASCVVTFPTVCAHMLGQILKFMGDDRLVFGSDSVHYGSPQWQIEALWRFQIPESIRKRWRYPEITKRAKRKILGLNSARLYRLAPVGKVRPRGLYRPVPEDYMSRMDDELKTIMEFPGYTADNMTKMREVYQASGASPSNTRYGWLRTRV
jgi:predicted TIM-barrel fold metal-dependent hydrolase